jgi:hypothetical protein
MILRREIAVAPSAIPPEMVMDGVEQALRMGELETVRSSPLRLEFRPAEPPWLSLRYRYLAAGSVEYGDGPAPRLDVCIRLTPRLLVEVAILAAVAVAFPDPVFRVLVLLVGAASLAIAWAGTVPPIHAAVSRAGGR